LQREEAQREEAQREEAQREEEQREEAQSDNAWCNGLQLKLDANELLERYSDLADEIECSNDDR